jgi:hypothetical protein
MTEQGSFNRLEAWASDFYELRKRLVHAKADKDASLVWHAGKRRFMHEYIASYVWFECLWYTMEQAGVIPPAPEETDDVSKCSWRSYAKWYWGWKSGVRNLGMEWTSFLTGKSVDD